MVEYTDLLFLTLIPIVMQSATIVYLWKIRKLIGRSMSWLLGGGINGFILAYDVMLFYLVLNIPARAIAEGRAPSPISIEGLFIGWVMPIAVGVFSLLLTKKLASSLLGVVRGG